MANNVIKRVWNQNRMVAIEDLKGMTFQAESGGHTFQISGVDDSGNTVALAGSVAGVFLRPDNTDVAITGSASGGVVSVTLPANCYDVPGRFGLTVFVTADGQKTAVYAAIGTVSRTSSGTVSPGTTADVVDLINQINAAVATIPASWTGLMADIAPTYSDTAVYPVGSYVYYNGDLYRCTTAITTAESWTAGHWTQAVLGNDVAYLKDAFNDVSPVYDSSYFLSWQIGKTINGSGQETTGVGFALSSKKNVYSETVVMNRSSDKGYNSKNATFYVHEYDSTGTWKRRTLLKSGQTKKINDDCKQIQIVYGYLSAESVTMTTEILSQYFCVSIIPKYASNSDFENISTIMADEIDSIKDITIDICKNMMNPALLTITGQYYSSGNGSHDDNAGFKSFSSVIPVKPGTTYTYSVDGTAGRMATCVQLDAEGNKTGGGYNVDSPFTTEANTASLLISLYVADTDDDYQLEEGSKPTSFVSYYAPRIRSSSDLEGKKICAFGDSLAAGDNGDMSARTWIDILCDYFGAVPYNRGIGGSCVTSENGSGVARTAYSYINSAGEAGEIRLAYTTQKTFEDYPTEINPCMNQTDRTNTIPTDTDIVIVVAGTNDIGSTTGADFQTAYETMLSHIITRVPNARIITCTMPFRHLYDDGTADDQTVYNGYRTRIINASEKYGFQCINLRKLMGVNADNYTTYMNDSVHYNNTAGRKRFASCIAQQIKDICFCE